MHTYLKIIGNIFKKFENKKKLYYVRIILCSWEPLYVGCGRAVWCMCLWMFDHLSAYSRFCISISDTIQVHFSGRIIKPTRAIHPQYAADLNLGFVVFFSFFQLALCVHRWCSRFTVSFNVPFLFHSFTFTIQYSCDCEFNRERESFQHNENTFWCPVCVCVCV